MLKLLKSLNSDQGGSVYIETALLIVGVALAVAPFMMALGTTLGNKVQDMKNQVEQVGV